MHRLYLREANFRPIIYHQYSIRKTHSVFGKTGTHRHKFNPDGRQQEIEAQNQGVNSI